MSVVDGVDSIMPERGRHDYPLLLQDEAVLNGEFLAEVPVVVESLGHFSLVTGHPSCVTSQSLLNVGSLAVA